MSHSIESFHIDRFKRFITDALGFQVEGDAAARLDDLLQDRLQASGVANAATYLEGLRDPQRRQEEVRAIAARLTVGETYFFRVPEQFRALAEVALPERLNARAGQAPVRILSAGCATGEEAYTIALLLRERFPALSPQEVVITGIDVNPAFLERARQACFTPWALRGLPSELRSRYFCETNRSFQLDRALASSVTFTEQNLLSDASPWKDEPFDIIFCRNVFIYFSPDATRKALSNLTQALAPGGFLFLGPAETLRGITRAFRLLQTHETFYYQHSHDETGHDPAPPSPPEPAVQQTEVQKTEVPSRPPQAPWVEAVQRAADRIASLTAQGNRSAEPPETVTGRTLPWDLSLTLERFKQERFFEALETLRKLPPDAERDPEVLLLRAAILTNAGDGPEAERVCREILALDEYSAGAHYLLALCREQTGDLEGAQRHNETATYLDPAFAMPRLHLGLLAKREGRHAQARRELERAQALLSREEASRILLFGGGFTGEALMELCAAEIRHCTEAR